MNPLPYMYLVLALTTGLSFTVIWVFVGVCIGDMPGATRRGPFVLGALAAVTALGAYGAAVVGVPEVAACGAGVGLAQALLLLSRLRAGREAAGERLLSDALRLEASA